MQKLWSQECAIVPPSSTLGIVTKMTKRMINKVKELKATAKEQHAFPCLLESATASLPLPPPAAALVAPKSVLFSTVPCEKSTVDATRQTSTSGTRMSIMMIMTRQKW